MKIYTIGHSTHPIDEFIEILQNYKINLLVDVRSVPHSRYNPQFDIESMSKSLPESGIKYIHLASLGGFRTPLKDSKNSAWKNKRFRGYADYMQTTDYLLGLKELIKLGTKYNVVICCSEAVPWRCHRSLIADSLIIRGITVIDIYNVNVSKEHNLTSFAKVKGDIITYPSEK
jgi:uncharacterized protein (DUF488 family)